MKTIAYVSPMVPAEWIAAHGLRPHCLRLRADGDEPLPAVTRGVCPYAGLLRATVISGLGVSGLDAAALVLTTTCDQMRYTAALLEQYDSCPVFLFNVPSTWQTPASGRLYGDELHRLGRFLETLGGKAPHKAELSQAMLAFDRQRNAKLWRFTGGGNRSGVPLAIIGGPLLETDDKLFEIIEHCGGRVALDGTEGGERTEPRPFDPARVALDPLAELADAYFGGIPDPLRRPNSPFYEWLGRKLAARRVRGIIFRRYLWCDLWHAELQRLRQRSALPVLEIDVGPDDTAAPGRVQGRIEAFLETLQ